MIRTILFILMGFPLLGYGQIRITSADMPTANTSHEYANAFDLTVDVSTTGANVNWDFSDLEANEYDVSRYVSSLQTIFLLQFGFTAVGEKVADTLGIEQFAFTNVHRFYRTTASQYRSVGIGFQFSQVPLPIAGVNNDPDEIFFFPLEYGNRDSSNFDVTTSLGLGPASIGSFRQTGYRITEVDGWGTITTPFVRNEACIRVKSTVVETDSILVPNPEVRIGVPRRRVEYKWLSNNHKIPVLAVTGTELGPLFIPTQIRYRVDWSDIDVDFYATEEHPRQEDTIQLVSQVEGKQLTYNWTISPDTGWSWVGQDNQNSMNPRIVFHDTGWHDVQLRVSNKLKTENELKTQYIHVHEQNGQPWCEHVSVYPNPSTDVLQYELGYHNPGHVQLIDMSGRVVWKSKAQERASIDVRHYPRGIYGIILEHCPKSYNTKVILK